MGCLAHIVQSVFGLESSRRSSAIFKDNLDLTTTTVLQHLSSSTFWWQSTIPLCQGLWLIVDCGSPRKDDELMYRASLWYSSSGCSSCRRVSLSLWASCSPAEGSKCMHTESVDGAQPRHLLFCIWHTLPPKNRQEHRNTSMTSRSTWSMISRYARDAPQKQQLR